MKWGLYMFVLFFLILFYTLTRFTKRHFVRHKNPQKLEDTYIIQFFSLNVNMKLILQLIQRFRSCFNFQLCSTNYFINCFMFFVYFIYFQRVANLMLHSRNLYVRWFCFHIFVNWPMRSKGDSKWKMASILRPLP